MKLSDLKKRGDEYTGKASDITRQLIFAGIAIIWLFKSEDNGYTTLDSFLILPLITLSLSIIFDLLHYVTGGIIWKKLYLSEEHKVIKKLKNEPNTNLDPENIKFTRKMNEPIYFFYRGKIALLLMSYVLILFYLIKNIYII